MIASKSLSESNKPVRLNPTFLEKVWGSTRLSPWYPDSEKKIGEVWFEANPLLIKFLFTTERLSVQVHPDDAHAAEHHDSLGKTEMWHILRTDPGAQIAVGFREEITPERLRESSLSGEIEQLLRWVDVHPGETFFTPAGTVHAIGAGLALCEIQQSSDVTYRLYDYGRPRELHLDQAMRVSDTSAHAGEPAHLPLICEYFHTDLLEVGSRLKYAPDLDRFHVLIILEGEGDIAGEAYRLGEVWYVPAGSENFLMHASTHTKILRTWVP